VSEQGKLYKLQMTERTNTIQIDQTKEMQFDKLKLDLNFFKLFTHSY